MTEKRERLAEVVVGFLFQFVIAFLVGVVLVGAVIALGEMCRYSHFVSMSDHQYQWCTTQFAHPLA